MGTSWLDSYNLTDRFNFWLELFGDNTDVYDTNDFNLTEYIAKDHGYGLEDYKEFLPLDSFTNEVNITQMLSYIAIDLATGGSMEITYNSTAIDFNSTRQIYVRDFDFSSFNLANVLQHG